MGEYVTLIGAEDVQRAANSMAHSASEMNRAASTVQDASYRFIQHFEELVQRLEAALEEAMREPDQELQAIERRHGFAENAFEDEAAFQVAMSQHGTGEAE